MGPRSILITVSVYLCGFFKCTYPTRCVRLGPASLVDLMSHQLGHVISEKAIELICHVPNSTDEWHSFFVTSIGPCRCKSILRLMHLLRPNMVGKVVGFRSCQILPMLLGGDNVHPVTKSKQLDRKTFRAMLGGLAKYGRGSTEHLPL